MIRAPKKKKPFLETAIENAVVCYAKQFIYQAVKMNTRGRAHWPDRMFMLNGGSPFFIEFKRTGEEPTPAQAKIHAELRAEGYRVYVADSVEIGKLVVDKELRRELRGALI